MILSSINIVSVRSHFAISLVSWFLFNLRYICQSFALILLIPLVYFSTTPDLFQGLFLITIGNFVSWFWVILCFITDFVATKLVSAFSLVASIKYMWLFSLSVTIFSNNYASFLVNDILLLLPSFTLSWQSLYVLIKTDEFHWVRISSDSSICLK